MSSPASSARLAEQRAHHRTRARRRRAAAITLAALAAALIAVPKITADRPTPLADIGVAPDAAGCSPVRYDPAEGSGYPVPAGTTVDYATAPPSSGPHLPLPAQVNSRGFYTRTDSPPVEVLVHNLEHGYTIAWYTPDLPEAELEALAGLQLCEESGADFFAAWCHHSLAWRNLFAGDPAVACTHAERALALAPPQGPGPFHGGHFEATLALVAALHGDAERAEALAARALQSVQQLPLGGLQAMALARGAAAATLTGRWARATDLLRELLTLLRRLGTDRWVGDALEFTGLLLEGTARPQPACRVLRAAHLHRVTTGEPTGSGIAGITSALQACRRRLGLGERSDIGSDAPAGAEQAVLLALQALDASL